MVARNAGVVELRLIVDGLEGQGIPGELRRIEDLERALHRAVDLDQIHRRRLRELALQRLAPGGALLHGDDDLRGFSLGGVDIVQDPVLIPAEHVHALGERRAAFAPELDIVLPLDHGGLGLLVDAISEDGPVFQHEHLPTGLCLGTRADLHGPAHDDPHLSALQDHAGRAHGVVGRADSLACYEGTVARLDVLVDLFFEALAELAYGFLGEHPHRADHVTNGPVAVSAVDAEGQGVVELALRSGGVVVVDRKDRVLACRCRGNEGAVPMHLGDVVELPVGLSELRADRLV